MVSATLGHATAAFTADVYVTVLEEIAEAATTAIEAFVPRNRTFRVSNESAEAEDDH